MSTRNDPRVIKKLAARAADEIATHYGDPDIVDEESIRSLESALRYNDDGYKICRSMDDDGWEVDAALVALMDQVTWWRDEACKEVEVEEAANAPKD